MLLPVAAYGGWLTWRRGVTLVPLIAQLALVTFIAATVYATARFAVPADVVVVLLAGVGVEGLVMRLRRGAPEPSLRGEAAPRPAAVVT